MQEVYMKCQLSPGMFSSEWTVIVDVGNDISFGSWVDKSNVFNVNQEETEGMLRVIILGESEKKDEHRLVVNVPYGTFNGQSSFMVEPELLTYNLP